MELLVLIQEVGAYSERQYNKQDGSVEFFKSRGLTMRHGGDTIYGEMTGEYASKNRDVEFDSKTPYVVKGNWRHRSWQDQNGQLRHENSFYISEVQPL